MCNRCEAGETEGGGGGGLNVMLFVYPRNLRALRSRSTCARAFRIELEFSGSVGFSGEGKTGVPGEKTSWSKKRTNNKLNPRMTLGTGIEPGPHW